MPRKAGSWDASFAAWDFNQSNKAFHPALYNKYSLYLSLRYCNIHISETVVRSCYVKIVFLKILQSSQVFSLAQEFPVNFATFLKNLFFRKTPPGIMCRIPGTWHDSSTMNITVEEFCQHRKKKKSWPWMLSNRASHYWRIVPVTVEQSYQGL